jgi:hypothetical protein
VAGCALAITLSLGPKLVSFGVCTSKVLSDCEKKRSELVRRGAEAEERVSPVLTRDRGEARGRLVRWARVCPWWRPFLPRVGLGPVLSPHSRVAGHLLLPDFTGGGGEETSSCQSLPQLQGDRFKFTMASGGFLVGTGPVFSAGPRAYPLRGAGSWKQRTWWFCFCTKFSVT